MEAAPSANPRRGSPPIPPNYVSLRQLQELRLKEKEEQEKRRREAEEAAAAAAARREAEKEAAARRDAEKAATAKREEEKAAAAKRDAEKTAAAKREAALKAETKGRAVSSEASGGAKERRRGGKGHQWVAVAHRAPAPTSRPLAPGHGAAGKIEAAIGGGRGEKRPDGAPDNGPNGGGKPLVKGKWKGKRKGKGKLAEPAPAPSHGGKLAEVVPASSPGCKPENQSESTAKGRVPGDQAAESTSSGGPAVVAEAGILSSRDCFRRRRPAGAGGRSAETCSGIAPVKTAGPLPPGGVRSDDTGEPRPPAPRRVDAVAGNGSPDGKRVAPVQAPRTSAADGSSKPTSGGELRKTMEAKPEGLVEGQRRRQVVEVQAVAELKSRVSRFSAGPWRGRGDEAVEHHGRVWVPKTAAAAAAAGTSAAVVL